MPSATIDPSTRGRLSPHTAALLRQARLARGLSLRAAARLLGVDPGYLSRLERGQRRPSIDVAHGLIRLLDADMGLAGDLTAQARHDRPST